MSARTAQLDMTTGILSDRLGNERASDSDGALGAVIRCDMLKKRVKDYQKMVGKDGILLDMSPRCDADVAHFAQCWTKSERDVYRFTAF